MTRRTNTLLIASVACSHLIIPRCWSYWEFIKIHSVPYKFVCDSDCHCSLPICVICIYQWVLWHLSHFLTVYQGIWWIRGGGKHVPFASWTLDFMTVAYLFSNIIIGNTWLRGLWCNMCAENNFWFISVLFLICVSFLLN